MVINWQPSHSLVEDAVSGAKISLDPFFLALAVTHLPLCLWGGRALNGIWFAILWYSLEHNLFFCEHAKGHHVALESCTGRFFFVCLFLWWYHGLGCYFTLAPSDCPQGIQIWSLPWGTSDAVCASLPSSHSVAAYTSIWTTSPLVVVVRHVFCVHFPLPPLLFCPLRFQSSPQTCLWEGFLLCGNLSFITPSQNGSPSLNLLFLFLYFIFCPTSFWRDWAAFLHTWCPLPASRSFLWKLFNIQMIFWWICGGESGLSILLLCHLWTSPILFFFYARNLVGNQWIRAVMLGLYSFTWEQSLLIAMKFTFNCAFSSLPQTTS